VAALFTVQAVLQLMFADLSRVWCSAFCLQQVTCLYYDPGTQQVTAPLNEPQMFCPDPSNRASALPTRSMHTAQQQCAMLEEHA
jgi:hypothetical protein